MKLYKNMIFKKTATTPKTKQSHTSEQEITILKHEESNFSQLLLDLEPLEVYINQTIFQSFHSIFYIIYNSILNESKSRKFIRLQNAYTIFLSTLIYHITEHLLFLREEFVTDFGLDSRLESRSYDGVDFGLDLGGTQAPGVQSETTRNGIYYTGCIRNLQNYIVITRKIHKRVSVPFFID